MESNLEEPRFFADVMLGSLARWLRILGYDTEYQRHIEDEELVNRCREESRIALTKDRRLVRRRALRDKLLIEGVHLGEQLREVLRRIGHNPWNRPRFTRCVECNVTLVSRCPEEVRTRVPSYVFRTQERFHECSSCHRIYWAGTHRDRMERRLYQLLQS